MQTESTASVVKDHNQNPMVSKRLNELGFGVNSQVTCVEALPFGGPKCFITRRGEFALDKEIAENIEIKSIDSKGKA